MLKKYTLQLFSFSSLMQVQNHGLCPFRNAWRLKKAYRSKGAYLNRSKSLLYSKVLTNLKNNYDLLLSTNSFFVTLSTFVILLMPSKVSK